VGARHPNYRCIKIHRTYTVDEIARLFQLHPNTVRAWSKQGLWPIDDRRPALFKGDVLAAFLRTRREKAKRPCRPGELYCLPCRQPKRPAGGVLEYIPSSPTVGNLRGICPTCHRTIHRRVNREKLSIVTGDLEVTLTAPAQRLLKRNDLLVKCELESEAAAGKLTTPQTNALSGLILLTFEKPSETANRRSTRLPRRLISSKRIHASGTLGRFALSKPSALRTTSPSK
jgi:hypothetical protein